MPPFRDEEEEQPRVRVQKASIFGAEPEERPRKMKVCPPPLRSRPGPSQHVLFGDEAEEASRTPSTSSRTAFTRQCPRLFGDEEEEHRGLGGPECESSSDDEGVQPATTVLNLSWSGLKMFQQATFLTKVAEQGKPESKKRPYDNSKRSRNAMTPKNTSTAKSKALDVGRLVTLSKKASCNCLQSALASASLCFLCRLLFASCVSFPSPCCSDLMSVVPRCFQDVLPNMHQRRMLQVCGNFLEPLKM